ncbi:MAG TPA: hypothetical protein VEH56_05955, partial [Candidatus Saccharimonadales bacterium]|nr:hypothetical protein [Candidatus Saccharimonadales bacterium]
MSNDATCRIVQSNPQIIQGACKADDVNVNIVNQRGCLSEQGSEGGPDNEQGKRQVGDILLQNVDALSGYR